MVEVLLRNSPANSAINITSYGFSCKHHSYISGGHVYRSRTHHLYARCCSYLGSEIKTNGRRARSYGLNILSMSKEGHAPSIRSNYSLTVPRKIASVEFGLVYEEGNKLIGKEKESVPLEQKLPPWGDLPIQLDSSVETSGVNRSSTISRGLGTVIENGLYFLEEKNEEILSERVLRLSRSNKVRSALALYRSTEYSGLQPNSHACNSLISCLLRNEMLDDALSIFEFMKANETITGHTYSLVLKAIANSWGYDAALHMFEELETESNLKKDFDAVVYNTMISVCGKVNNWVQTERIWRSMKVNGHTGTVVTYRLLVCIFVRCGQNELAIDAYSEMVQNRLNPGDDAMQAIIGACSKEGKCDLALNTFVGMLNKGIKPNLITCNAVINLLGKDGQVKLAFSVLGLMRSLGHAPDAYTWNALLGALYRANRHADALQLFESIRKEQSSLLNLHLYNTCLMCCQRLGLWNRAVQLLWHMEASALPVSTASYNLVIGACEVGRKPNIALQVYEHMIHRKCAPDTFTLLSLIRGCIWGSRWYEVEEMLNQAAPDASLYNAAIQGMCLRGEIDLAKKLYMRMRKTDLKPDGKTRAFMLQNLPKVSTRRQKRKFHRP